MTEPFALGPAQALVQAPTLPPFTPALEDKRLDRLYDYTKFHIGIYLSAAGGIATLLGSEKAGWFIASLVGTEWTLYAALLCMVLAGMCGGVVATSITESQTFSGFWAGDHGPASMPKIRASGQKWVDYEHRFFWSSLLLLIFSVIVKFPSTPQKQILSAQPSVQNFCPYQAPSALVPPK